MKLDLNARSIDARPYDPNLIPVVTGNTQEKRNQFYRWLDEQYPNDIEISPDQLAYQDKDKKWHGFLISPFGHRGAWFATVVSNTKPNMRKTNNPNADARKRTWMMVQGGNWSYSNAVNNARDKMIEDGPVYDDSDDSAPLNTGTSTRFVPKSRKWGERIEGVGLVRHNDKLYFEARVMSCFDRQFVNTSGKLIPDDKIKPFLSEKKSQAEYQGVSPDKEIILRDITILGDEHRNCNIEAIRFANRTIWIS